MTRPTLIFLPPPGLRDLTAAWYDGQTWQVGPLRDAKVKGSDKILALAPGTDARTLPISLSIRSESDARRAALFAIEDDVATSVEALHLAISPMGADGKRHEAVICDMDLMTAWIAMLDAAGYQAVPIYAELSLLPVGSVILGMRDRILVRTDDGQAFAIDKSMPPEVLHALMPRDAVGNSDGASTDDLRGDVSSAAGVEQLASWAVASDQTINLRQGNYALKRQSDFNWNSFRWPAALAATALLTWTAGLWLETRALKAQTQQLDAEARRIYQTANTGEPVPQNLLQAVASKQTQIAPDLSVLDAGADLYTALAELEAASIRSLRFNRETAELQAGLIYGAYGDELKVKADLEAKGYRVELGDTRQVNGLVIGDVTFGGAG